ncbi:MAG: PD40 domain-containing protein [Gemmatimonadetes bacterium]|nr:PD40 domain-containing protein [Gemmatimonadota bacterium]
MDDVRTGATRRLSDWSWRLAGARVSPDGRYLAFCSDRALRRGHDIGDPGTGCISGFCVEAMYPDAAVLRIQGRVKVIGDAIPTVRLDILVNGDAGLKHLAQPEFVKRIVH